MTCRVVPTRTRSSWRVCCRRRRVRRHPTSWCGSRHVWHRHLGRGRSGPAGSRRAGIAVRCRSARVFPLQRLLNRLEHELGLVGDSPDADCPAEALSRRPVHRARIQQHACRRQSRDGLHRRRGRGCDVGGRSPGGDRIAHHCLHPPGEVAVDRAGRCHVATVSHTAMISPAASTLAAPLSAAAAGLDRPDGDVVADPVDRLASHHARHGLGRATRWPSPRRRRAAGSEQRAGRRRDRRTRSAFPSRRMSAGAARASRG